MFVSNSGSGIPSSFKFFSIPFLTRPSIASAFEGYQLENDRWQYVEKIFNQRYEQAPVPEPILKDDDKDIFGK